jgi:chromosome segregation ATPase
MTLNALLVGALYVSARSNRTTSQAVGQLATTNIALNNELQEAIKDRRANEDERVAMREQVVQLTTEKNLLSAEVSQVRRELTQDRDDNKRAVDVLGQELIKVKKELAAAREEMSAMKQTIADLTAALKLAQERASAYEARERQLTLELAEAKGQIAQLQRDNLTKDNKIASLTSRVTELESELQRVQQDRARLEQEKAELLKQLEHSTSDPDEGKPDEPETNLEPKEDNHG